MKISNNLTKLSVFSIILVLTLSFTLAITETGTDEGTLLVGTGSVYTCQEQWTCSWSECIGNSQTYVCTDLNDCGTNNLEPENSGATQTCGTIINTGGGGGGGGGSTHNYTSTSSGSDSTTSSTSCQEDWVCQQWSNLEGECGERVCEDQNECGTEQLKPLLEKGCETTRNSRFTGAAIGITEKVLTTPGIYVPLIFVFLVAAGGLTVLLFAGRKKDKGYAQP
jgi:hypothetical protein